MIANKNSEDKTKRTCMQFVTSKTVTKTSPSLSMTLSKERRLFPTTTENWQRTMRISLIETRSLETSMRSFKMVSRRSRHLTRRSRKEMNIFKKVTKLSFLRVWNLTLKTKLWKHPMRTWLRSTWNILTRNLSLERKIWLCQMITRSSNLDANSWLMAWKMWQNKIKISFKKSLSFLTKEKNWSNKTRF